MDFFEDGSPVQILRVLLFITAVSAVYVAAAGLMARRIWQRWKGLPRRLPLGDGVVRLVWFLAVFGAFCMAYGYWVEPYWPEVRRVRLSFAKLRGATRPVRLVHISDIHSDAKVRLEERLPGIIAGLNPDLIVFTGDAVNSPEGLPIFKTLMGKLSRLAPTYAVKGNWDIIHWGALDLFGGTGVVELKGRGRIVPIAGAHLMIAGLPPFLSLRVKENTAEKARGSLLVWLSHYPDEIQEAALGGVDLYLAGHTHGGQVALPLYGALITFSRFDKLFEHGLHRVGKAWLYVTRGIGMEGGFAPRVRFWARPEITLLELTPEAAP